MLFEAVILSLITGKIRKRKLKNLENINIKVWYLFIIGFIIQFIIIYFLKYDITFLSHVLKKYFFYLHFISYILILLGLILNLNQKFILYVFIGTVLNFIVIFTNGGYMPVSVTGLSIAGLKNINTLPSQLDATHILLSNTCKLRFLADIIPIPKPYFLPKLISIGDIFISVGIFLFLQRAMEDKDISYF